MADQRSTSEITLIAQNVVAGQERVCQVHRESLSEKLRTMSELAQSNLRAVSELAKTVAVLATVIEPLAPSIKENETEIDALKSSVHKLTRRPAFWAALGSALPVAAGVLWELIRTKP